MIEHAIVRLNVCLCASAVAEADTPDRPENQTVCFRGALGLKKPINSVSNSGEGFYLRIHIQRLLSRFVRGSRDSIALLCPFDKKNLIHDTPGKNT